MGCGLAKLANIALPSIFMGLGDYATTSGFGQYTDHSVLFFKFPNLIINKNKGDQMGHLITLLV